MESESEDDEGEEKALSELIGEEALRYFNHSVSVSLLQQY